MSLTKCIAKAGAYLQPADKKAILEAARTYRASGLSANEAGIKAVDDILNQAKSQVAELVKASIEAMRAPAPQIAPEPPRAAADKTEAAEKPKAEPAKAPEKIDDIGEKIGGARKPGKRQEDGGTEPMFSRAAKEDPRDLIIQHNLTADNLLFAARMGGLPVPSLAITKAEAPMKNFGEITLLGDVNMADPKQGIKAYGADIYSPRYPRVTYQFTPNMRARAEKQVKAGLDATNTYIDWSEVERDGADELNRQPALMWEFLSSKGITPTIVRVEPKPLDPAIQPFANDTRNSFELAQDPAFQAAAWAAHQEMLTQAYGDAKEAQAEIEKMQQTARERGRSQVVNGYVNGLDQYRRDKAVAGRVDTSATKRAMDAQIHDAGLTDEFRASNRQLMRDLAPNERMFQGYTDSGKRRYKPHTLDNVIAILKKELRGGENFNYGAGSLRAKFTPQFKSVAQIRANKDRLVSNEQFEAIKAEANNDLQMIAESLNKPTDTAIAIMEDAPRMGLGRAAAQYDVDLSDSQREMIGGYMTRLRNMPTEYFEGKLLRAVGIGEFKAAVVPENISDDVLKLLDREGVTVFRYTGNRDGADRARAIQQAAKEIPGLMFSRTPAWRSELRDQIAAIKMESSKPEGWRAYIGGLTSKGVKPDEIEWSGITDWLKLQTGKVTKQQVLDYLDGNGVQVQEVVLGEEITELPSGWTVEQDRYGNWEVRNERGTPVGTPQRTKEAALSVMPRSATPTKYSQYTLPGGTNYREVLLTLPDEHERRKAELFKFQAEMRAKYNAGLNWGQFATPEERAHARRLSDDPVVGYRSTHWDTPNVLAHIRLNDRVDSEGRRVLFVEEVQSDYGQEGKKKGFAPKNPANPTDDEVRDFFGLDKSVDAAEYRDEMVEALRKRDRAGTLPRAPFVTSTDKWLSLALKRIITMAAQEGYDKVAFVNGEQSAGRYSLDQHVDRLSWKSTRTDGAARYVQLDIPDNNPLRLRVDGDGSVLAANGPGFIRYEGKRLDEIIGKDLADKVLKEPNGELSGDGLKVEAKGMRAFYDKILPNTLKDVLKKVGGGSLETVSLGGKDMTPGFFPTEAAARAWLEANKPAEAATVKYEPRYKQWSIRGENGSTLTLIPRQTGFTITPEMREKAANGLPMFRPGSEAAGMPLAKAQSIVADLTKKWKNGPPVAVVASPSDLPMNAPDDARGVYWKGKVWIVAGPHKDRADIARTLSHEAVAHYGLRNILSADEWRQYMRNIQLAIKSGNKPLTKIRDQVRSAYVDGDGKLYLTEQQEADEIAAKVVEQAIGPDGEFRPGFGFVKSVYARIMQFLRELGLDVKLTLAEVQGMLVLAQKNLEAGKRTVGQGDAVVAAGRGDQRPMDMRLDESRMGAFAGDPSPEEALSVQSAIEGKTAIEAADFIAQTAPEKQMRVIASRVADQMRKLEDAGMNFTLNVAHLGDQTHSQMAGKMRGMTWRAFGSSNVDVFVQGADVTGLVGTSYETVLHELLHAVTQSAIYAGQQAGNTALNKDVQDLQLVHDAIIRHFNQSIAGKTVGELDNYIERIVARGHNALREMDEVVSWGLTNKAMQDYLESIPYKNTTLWGEFVSAIRKFLGLPESAETVLSEVLRITDRLLDAPVAQLTTLEMPTQTNYSGGLLNGARTGKDQTDTPAFKAWFGDSVVTDTGKAGGKPIVLYHGTARDFSSFDPSKLGANTRTTSDELGFFFTSKPFLSDNYAELAGRGGWNNGPSGNPVVYPVYLSLRNPKIYNTATEFYREGDKRSGNHSAWRKELQSEGYDGVVVRGDFEEVIAFSPTQIKSVFNRGSYAPADPNIMFSRGTTAEPGREGWDMQAKPELDNLIYELQDGSIDLKRVQEAIKKTGADLEERFDARLAETLYPGRVAKRSENFLKTEVRPLLQAMALLKVDMTELGDYLIARHAPERNAQIAKINPDLPDGGAGRNSEGTLMTDDAAAEYLEAIPADKLRALETLAAKVDAITAGTRNLWVSEGLETPEAVRAMEQAYKHYVPLFKDEAEFSHPQGMGFSVRGAASKRAMGSTKEVTNVLAHVLMAREAAITRAEKNRVGMALYGLALSYPNPDFWTVIRPNMSNTAIAAELSAMGVDPEMMGEGMSKAPTIRTIDPVTNTVVDRPNPAYKNMDNAMVIKVAGEDRVIVFNQRNERAMRMVGNLKNLDGLTKLDLVNSVLGKATRYIASVNTQYNPVFGLVNIIRDTQGAVLNLSTTPIADKKRRVLADIPAALIGIARALRGDERTEWSDLWEQYQEDGGQTGYREMFRAADDRAKAIEKELQSLDKSTPGKMAHAVLDLMDDFNTALENATRLSAYKAALDSGLSRKEAARIGKELTVNFNRKGRSGRELSPLYAFMNAAIQGNVRILETLKSPMGAKILAGGLMLGAAQALMLAAAGFDDDDIPEWDKARALIIPVDFSSKRYIKIPIALGLNVIPNTGRVLTEIGLNGGKDAGAKVVSAIGEILGAMNPMGGGNVLTADGALKLVAPTVADPIIEVIANRNFAGGRIEREAMENDGRPGYQRARESTLRSATGQVYTGISKALNFASQGSAWEAGSVSPTPEMVRYVARVFGGGLLGEIERVIDAGANLATGKETKATRIPLTSRFYGEVDADQVEQRRFYEAARKIQRIERSVKAAKKAGDQDEADRIASENEIYQLAGQLENIQARLRKLNKQATETINNPAEIRDIDEARTDEMKSLNDEVRALEAERYGQTVGSRLRKIAAQP